MRQWGIPRQSEKRQGKHDSLVYQLQTIYTFLTEPNAAQSRETSIAEVLSLFAQACSAGIQQNLGFSPATGPYILADPLRRPYPFATRRARLIEAICDVLIDRAVQGGEMSEDEVSVMASYRPVLFLIVLTAEDETIYHHYPKELGTSPEFEVGNVIYFLEGGAEAGVFKEITGINVFRRIDSCRNAQTDKISELREEEWSQYELETITIV